MKIQIGANLVISNSKQLASKNPKAVQDALTAPAGKRKMLVVTFTDDNGHEVELSVPLRKFKSEGIGGYLSLKAEGKIVTVDAPVGKDVEQAEKSDAKLAALTDELLGE
jgi:hypothetical protein